MILPCGALAAVCLGAWLDGAVTEAQSASAMAGAATAFLDM